MEQACSFESRVSEKEVRAFAELSGDFNPLHTDADYARETEFGRPIAHGALLVGFVSRVLGMHIPGKRSLVLSMRVQFPKPLYYPTTVRVSGKLQDFDPERNIGAVRVSVTDVAKLSVVLESDVVFSLHAVTGKERPPEARAEQALKQSAGNGRKLLVTGGSGGVGRGLLPLLAPHYELCSLSRTGAIAVDFEKEGALETVLSGLDPAEFYGVLHLSVPPAPQKFVSDDIASLRRHLRHSVEVPVLIAQWARQSGSGVKRMVLFGSTAGAKYPKPKMGAYSLGKAAMEHLAKLLAYDLAPQGATVNIVVPTAIPAGLNEGMPARFRSALAGNIPTGRLPEPRDLAAVALFLLSENASQINGASIGVDGGLIE